MEALAGLVETSPEAADSSALAALRQRLAALDATVVEYAAGGDNMFAFVIDSDHIHVVPLGSRVEIGSAATTLYERLRNPESAAQDVRNAASNLRGARARLENATRQVALAQEVFRIAQVRQAAGAGTYVETVDAQTTLTTARNNLVRARYDVLTAYSQLQRAVGTDRLPTNPASGAQP